MSANWGTFQTSFPSVPVNFATKDTPISYEVVRVIGVVHNHIVSLFDKVLNKNDTISSDKTVTVV